MKLNKAEQKAAFELLKIMNENSMPIDAVTLSWKFKSEYDLRFDWHEFSSLLDLWYRQGKLVISKPGGMVQYRLEE